MTVERVEGKHPILGDLVSFVPMLSGPGKHKSWLVIRILPEPGPLADLAEELVARGEADGGHCVDLSVFSDVVQASQLDDDDLQALQDMLEERGLDVRDDCGRDQLEQTSYLNEDLASVPPTRWHCSCRRSGATRC